MIGESNVIAYWWKLYLNDKEIGLSNKSKISNITYDNPINGSDTVTFSLSDPEMEFVNDNIYKDDTPVTAKWGVYETIFSTEFRGYISAIDIDFPSDGIPTLKITVMDDTHRMNRTKKKRSWENTTNAAVVQAIAKEYGFKCEIENGYSFKTEETISQDNVTDIAFIENLAGNEDDLFYCKLMGDTIHYKKQGLLANPVVRCAYKQDSKDLISFSPKITIEDKQIDEKSADINTSSLDTVSSKATEETNKEPQGSSSKTSTSTKHIFDPKTQTWKT